MLLLAAAGLRAQPSGGQTGKLTIKDIRVEGATTSAPSAIINISRLRIGQEITSNEPISNAVRKLMEQRFFSDVKIYADSLAGEEGTIIIAVKEYPRISSVTFTGNDELSEKDLKAIVTLQPGEVAFPYALDSLSRAIVRKYSAEGYLFSTVNAVQTASTDSNRVSVTFNINEGPEVHIGRIAFVGNQAIDESDLKGAMQDVKEKSWWQFWRSSKFDRSKLADDEKRVVDYYHSRGYIDASVVHDTIALDPATGSANVAITVSEGKPYYLRSIAVTGNKVFDTTLILKRLDMAVGKPFNETQLEKNVQGNEEQTDLRSLYLDNGYLHFDAAVETAKIGADSIDVLVTINEGQQATIRYVEIAGNTKTKDKVIRRELFTRPGATFSKAAIIRSLRNLANLNYFNPEKLQPDVQPANADATAVDITYQVEERPSDTFNASVGISSQGLTGVLGVSFNNFSITEPLTGGAGQILNFNWEFGSYLNTFSLGFTEPWLFDRPLTLGANVFYRTEDLSQFTNTEGYRIHSAGGTLTLGHRLRWPDDYFRVDLTNRMLYNKILGTAPANSAFRNGSEISHTLTVSRSSLDNPFFPTVGSRFVFANTVAALGDAKFTKHELTFDFYSPVAQLSEANQLVFYLNNEYGYVNDFGNIDNIAPTTFYAMGGTVLSGLNTIQLRGYRDNSIGPFGLSDVPLGKLYAKVTAELRLGIAQNPIPIYALTFAEAGNLWMGMKQVEPFDLKRSMGVGLRVMIPPIGLLGFDYGYGFDADSYGRPPSWQFHFQFGH
jgi:outer membrane protein insertion porin family